MRLALDLLLGLFVVLSLLPLTRQSIWWVRIWDFPRLQLLAFAGVVGSARWLLGAPFTAVELGLFVAAGAAGLFQVYWILPFTPFWRKQVAHNHGEGWATLSLIVVNVLMENRESDRLLAILREHDPDVVLALETDQWWCQRLRQLTPHYPHRVEIPIDNTYGMALYAKPPLLEPQTLYRLEQRVPSIRAKLQLEPGRLVELWAVHPAPPAPQWTLTSTPRDAELVLVAREIEKRPQEARYPAVVAGDLNDVAWSHTTRLFLRLSGLLDPRVGRGFYNSFDATRPYLRWPLDHVFHSPEWALRRLERLPAFGSDHFPILIELGLKPGIAAEQTPEPPELEDKDEAREIMTELRAERAAGIRPST